MLSHLHSKRRIALLLLSVLVVAHVSSARAGSAAVDSTNLSRNIELAFGEAMHALQILITQGPSAFIDVVKHWLLNLANAIPNSQSN